MWVCDEKRGAHVGRRAMEMKIQRRRKMRRPKRRCLDRERIYIKEKALSADKCTIVLYGGVDPMCHRISTPHNSGNKMKRNEEVEGHRKQQANSNSCLDTFLYVVVQ